MQKCAHRSLMRTFANNSRSSALLMDASLAPISSTLYFSRMPLCGRTRGMTIKHLGARRSTQLTSTMVARAARSCPTPLDHRRTSDSAFARLRAVWPPMVGRMASGRSFSRICSTSSGVMGPT